MERCRVSGEAWAAGANPSNKVPIIAAEAADQRFDVRAKDTLYTS
jgi:hypothetical protein